MKTLNLRPFVLFALVALLLAVGLATTPGPAQAATRGFHTELSAAPAGTGCSYYVHYGDSLYGIALRYGTTYYQLTLMNALANPNWIYVGQRLNVPCGSSTLPSADPGNYGLPICSYYVVQRGDWLTLIAARYGTTWTAIAKVNGLRNPNFVYAGQRLAIPCPGSVGSDGQSEFFTSSLYGYRVQVPAGWIYSVNHSTPPAPGSNPEFVAFSARDSVLPQINLDVLTGAPPFSGYESCNKNLVFRGFPACSFSLPQGQQPAQRLLVFQKRNAYFHIAMLYENENTQEIWDNFLTSFSFQ